MSKFHNDSYPTGSPLYLPLDGTVPQIRLIKVDFLQPDEPEDSLITCSMITTPIESMEDQYLALSYAWGDANNRRPIVVNNHRYLVTANLEGFLQVWRRKAVQERDEPLEYFYLWIDAICINQEDLLERESQVMLMSKIYPKAKRTLAWLGHGCSSCEYGVESICLLAAHVKDWVEDDNKANYLEQEAWPSRFYDYDVGLEGSIKNRAWQAFKDFLHVDYWSRAWIQQEYVLGKTVAIWYGETETLSSDLTVVHEWLHRIHLRARPDFFNSRLWDQLTKPAYQEFFVLNDPLLRFNNLAWARLPENEKSAPLVFILLYISTISVKASDPRDMLYSLLGVLDLDITADYQGTVEEVYYRFAARWITRPGGLAFLLGAQGPSPVQILPEIGENNPRPTWTPHWNAQDGNFWNIGINFSFELNNAEDSQQSTSIVDRCLMVQGQVMSLVKMKITSPQALMETYFRDSILADPSTANHRLRCLLYLLHPNTHPFWEKHSVWKSVTPNSEDPTWTETLDAVRSVVISIHAHFASASISDILHWMGMLNLGDVAQMLRRGRIPPDINPHEPTIEGGPNDYLLFYNPIVESNLKEHTPFITTDDRLALSLRDIDVDGVMCVLAGLKTPIILRGFKGSYQFISPCRILDLSYEDLPIAGSEPDKLETFNIY